MSALNRVGARRGELWCALTAVEAVERQERLARERANPHTAPRRTEHERELWRLNQRIAKKTRGRRSSERGRAIAEAAWHDLAADLQKFNGDTLNHRHEGALKNILVHLSLLAERCSPGTGKLSTGPERWGFDLDAGCGKTRSIISWCRAVYDAGMPYTVTIFGEQVEDLAVIWREMVEKGIPEDMIAIYHTKGFDPGKAEKARKRELPANEAKHYASLPATKDWQSRPILLTTHSRLKNEADTHSGSCLFLDRSTGQMRERDVCVWDEALIVSKARTLSYADLRLARATLAEARSLLPNEKLGEKLRRDFGVGMKWLGGVIDDIERALAEDSRPKLKLSLPSSFEEDIAAMESVLALVSKDNTQPTAVISQIGDYAGDFMTVFREEGSGIADTMIRIEREVPEDLRRVVVLDASYLFRSLTQMPGSTVRRALPDYGRLKHYDRVTLHIAEGTSSATKVENQDGAKFLNAVCDVVEQVPADEAIIVWVPFDDVKRKRPRLLHTKLRGMLEERGVDLAATVSVPGGDRIEQRPRIVFRTWGKQLADNGLAYCRHAVFVSLLFKPKAEVAGQAVAQGGDLRYRPTDLEEVWLREALSDFYQATCRGSVRLTDSALQAHPMHVWFAVRQPRLLELITVEAHPDRGPAFPGAQVVEWKIGGEERRAATPIGGRSGGGHCVPRLRGRPGGPQGRRRERSAGGRSASREVRLWADLKERGVVRGSTRMKLLL